MIVAKSFLQFGIEPGYVQVLEMDVIVAVAASR